MKKLRRAALLVAAGLAVMCALAAGTSAYINSRQPRRSAVVDRLCEADNVRLAEATHLRQTLGDGVWPGWGTAGIPLVLYNERNAFLVGLERPAAGWIKVPDMATRGGPWLPVEGDTASGREYYYQPVEDAGRVIGGFTVRVGER